MRSFLIWSPRLPSLKEGREKRESIWVSGGGFRVSYHDSYPREALAEPDWPRDKCSDEGPGGNEPCEAELYYEADTRGA